MCEHRGHRFFCITIIPYVSRASEIKFREEGMTRAVEVFCAITDPDRLTSLKFLVDDLGTPSSCNMSNLVHKFLPEGGTLQHQLVTHFKRVAGLTLEASAAKRRQRQRESLLRGSSLHTESDVSSDGYLLPAGAGGGGSIDNNSNVHKAVGQTSSQATAPRIRMRSRSHSDSANNCNTIPAGSANGEDKDSLRVYSSYSAHVSTESHNAPQSERGTGGGSVVPTVVPTSLQEVAEVHRQWSIVPVFLLVRVLRQKSPTGISFITCHE